MTIWKCLAGKVHRIGDACNCKLPDPQTEGDATTDNNAPAVVPTPPPDTTDLYLEEYKQKILILQRELARVTAERDALQRKLVEEFGLRCNALEEADTLQGQLNDAMVKISKCAEDCAIQYLIDRVRKMTGAIRKLTGAA